MRNKCQILKDFVELTTVKTAYSHYLASARSLTEVENATRIKQNYETITLSLNLLRLQIAKAKQFPGCTASPLPADHSLAEQNAILHFNRDRRFSITE